MVNSTSLTFVGVSTLLQKTIILLSSVSALIPGIAIFTLFSWFCSLVKLLITNGGCAPAVFGVAPSPLSLYGFTAFTTNEVVPWLVFVSPDLSV